MTLATAWLIGNVSLVVLIPYPVHSPIGVFDDNGKRVGLCV